MIKLPFALAKRFVAGETFEQALPKVQQLNQKKIKTTLDMLGEDVDDRQTADETVESYKKLLRQISRHQVKSSISVKLSMMGLDIDREYCRDNLFELLEVARREEQFVRVDMEGSSHTEMTINIFKEAFEHFGRHVGVVIQAYLHRSKKDIPELAAMGADIRLCKGAYGEPERIALQNMPAIREAYKEYARILLQKTAYPRIATHDNELIDWVKSYTDQHDIGPARFEFQMLYGLRQPTMEEMSRQGYNTRIYVPYGTMWFPYFKRRLTERKENIWFVLSTLFQK